ECHRRCCAFLGTSQNASKPRVQADWVWARLKSPYAISLDHLARVVVDARVRDKHIAELFAAFMTLSNPLKPPTSTTAAPAREWATAPADRGMVPFVSVAIPRPHALVSAPLTDTVQTTRYTPNYPPPHQGKCWHHPSSAVASVASCHRAMPSFKKHLRNAASATTHRRATP